MAIKTIQEIINQRAKDRLDKDIAKVNSFLWSASYHLLGNAKVYLNVNESGEPKFIPVDLRSIMHSTYSVADKVFDSNIEQYTEEETKNFLAEFEELKDRMNNLEGQVDNIRND